MPTKSEKTQSTKVSHKQIIRPTLTKEVLDQNYILSIKRPLERVKLT